MKQQGKTWITAEGEQTLSKYLPPHEKLFEKLGQRIVAEATDIETRLYHAKKMFVDTCNEALRNSPNKDNQRRFTFTTFDKEYKIEFDIKEEYVRIYRATKRNPSSKDYELVNMDFNKVKIENTEEQHTDKTVTMTPEQYRREQEIEDERLQDQLEGIEHIPATPESYVGTAGDVSADEVGLTRPLFKD